MATFKQLQASIARTTTVEGSAIAFIKGLIQNVRDAGTDAEREAALTELETNADALAAALVENTPAAKLKR